jgi:hypothetical protein
MDKKKFESTKLIIGAVMLCYFISLIFSMFYIEQLTLLGHPEYATDCFKTWLTFVGVPVPVSIAFYCWKAKGENIPKQYQRMLNDITDPQLKAIFLNSIGNGNLDLTKNKMGSQYSNIGNDDSLNIIDTSIDSIINPILQDDKIVSEDNINDIIMDDIIMEEG